MHLCLAMLPLGMNVLVFSDALFPPPPVPCPMNRPAPSITRPAVGDVSAQECLVQGIANMMCGMFGAIGGSALIGETVINVLHGAKVRHPPPL